MKVFLNHGSRFNHIRGVHSLPQTPTPTIVQATYPLVPNILKVTKEAGEVKLRADGFLSRITLSSSEHCPRLRWCHTIWLKLQDGVTPYSRSEGDPLKQVLYYLQRSQPPAVSPAAIESMLKCSYTWALPVQTFHAHSLIAAWSALLQTSTVAKPLTLYHWDCLPLKKNDCKWHWGFH